MVDLLNAIPVLHSVVSWETSSGKTRSCLGLRRLLAGYRQHSEVVGENPMFTHVMTQGFVSLLLSEIE
jgi:hypothetical protein